MSDKPAVEVEAVAEAQAVEAAAVEAEATPEAAELSANAETAAQETAPDIALTAERDTLKGLLSTAQADAAQLTERATKAEAQVEALTAQVKAQTERATKAETRLAAIEKGAPPLSGGPAPKDGELTPWEKAKKSGRNRK